MGSLPKTRPQRSSARRNAARSKVAAKTESKPRAATANAKPSVAKARPKPSVAKAKPKPRAAKAQPKLSVAKAKPKPRAAKAELPRAPRQGFEAESDVDANKPVQPPGGAELAASVVELIGELAQTGLTSGGRLLKDALSRLSPS